VGQSGFTEARDSEWQWHQLSRLYASLHLAPDRYPWQHPTTQFFYRPDALPAAQPTASKHRRQRRQGVRIRKNKQVCVDPCTLALNMTLPTATLGHLQLAGTRHRQLSISAACAQAVASSK